MNQRDIYRILRNMDNRKAIKEWININAPVYNNVENIKVYILHNRGSVNMMSFEINYEGYKSPIHGRFYDTDDASQFINTGIYNCTDYKNFNTDFYSFLIGLERKRKVSLI
jgi:hypothetical protein